ncbi:MAG: UDP-N-acetylmuramate--L-alanine ligase, partial [Flavobacteriales bacterium]|nr:UDP-N-acetylmuramate--L-alanine ligase [Flavobacteriales bacterium]
MTDQKPDIAYFLGIGGIGMSALALFYHSEGVQVMGYDKTRSAITESLEEKGLTIHFTDHEDNIPNELKAAGKEKTLVVYTPAIPKESREWKWFRDHEYTIIKRSEALAHIANPMRCVAVAGTHGKTTT